MLEIRVLRDPHERKAVLHERDLEDNIEHFHRELADRPDRTYIAALSEGKVVGLAGLIGSSMRHPGAMGLCFLSTHRDYRNQGVATALASELFAHAENHGAGIACSPYEELGRRYLKHVLTRTAAAHPAVSFFEREEP